MKKEDIKKLHEEDISLQYQYRFLTNKEPINKGIPTKEYIKWLDKHIYYNEANEDYFGFVYNYDSYEYDGGDLVYYVHEAINKIDNKIKRKE